ncbi:MULTISPECIES: DUF7709 family protein [unclassified Moraxella]|uniref:DUF7709 family protein n=1 Tax=unclassified Moraxella TaxID=2685852 RepID=UPI003AF51E2D
MSKPQFTDELANINQKILADGETLPQVTMKDGTKVQTGTVATMLHNIERYNAGERGDVEQELIQAIPTLIKIGMFELFSVDEWASNENLGRNFLAKQARQLIGEYQKILND